MTRIITQLEYTGIPNYVKLAKCRVSIVVTDYYDIRLCEGMNYKY